MIFRGNDKHRPTGLLGQEMGRQAREKEKEKKARGWLETAFLTVCVLVMLASVFYIFTRPANLGSYLPGLIGLTFFLIVYFRQWLNRKTRRGFGRLVRRVFTLGMAVFLISFTVLCGAMFAAANNVPEEGADAVIVLGAGLVGGDRVSLTLSLRLNEAARYLRANEDTIVITSGGQGADESISEALAMKNYLVAIGIDENRVLMESHSTTTEENFQFSKEVLDDYFGREDYTVVYVTNDFHVFRSGLYAKKAGFQAEGLASSSPFYMLPSFYTREYCGLLMYGLTSITG